MPLYLFVFFMVMILPCQIFASPWVVDVDHYNIYVSGMTVDSISRKRQEARLRNYIKCKKIKDKLYSLKKEIEERFVSEKRDALNLEKIILEQIERDMETLEKVIGEMKSFNDDYSTVFDIEYGVEPEQSIGIKMNYANEKSFEYNDVAFKKNACVYHKYNFYDHKNYIATFQSSLSYTTENNDEHSKYADFGLLVGRSNYIKKKSYYSWQASFRKFFNRDIGFIFSHQHGFEFIDSFFLDNYTEYQYIMGANRAYNNIMYAQVLLSKSFAINQKKVPLINTQIGYFWKRSLLNRNYQLSGPTVSAWLCL